MRELDLEELVGGMVGGRGVERVAAFGAHPDDCEFSAGGTLARLVDLGAEVTLVVCTDGSRGGRGLDDIALVRSGEQERAAEELGVKRIQSLGRVDGEVVCDDALRGDVVRAIRELRPELVLTHDPTTLWRRFGSRTFMGHTDHRAMGQAVLDAIYPRAGNPNFFPEQLVRGVEPWEPHHLWLFDTAAPDARAAIDATLERKLAALARHESQSRSAGGLVEAARRMATSDGEPAETFQAHRLRGAPHRT
jgi:LmbE family N-acetylglucosaminyl deacetylase